MPLTIDLVLSIIDQSLTWANNAWEAMTAEQKHAFLARHEARMERLDGLLAKLTGKDDQGATA